MVRGLKAKVRKRLVVCAAHFVVDLYEACNWIAWTIRIKFADDFLNKGVAHLQIMDRIPRLLLLGKLEYDWAGDVVPRPIGRVNKRYSIGRHIPCEGEE